MTLTT